jgi:hypothetical protein
LLYKAKLYLQTQKLGRNLVTIKYLWLSGKVKITKVTQGYKGRWHVINSRLTQMMACWRRHYQFPLGQETVYGIGLHVWGIDRLKAW